MYEAFFQLKKRPFSATPDATCCYLGDSVTSTLAELMHCVEAGQGIGILTGAAGTGKTLLCRKLVSDFNGQFKTAFIGTGNLPTRRALLQAILYELQHPYSGMSEQELRLELISAAKSLIPQHEGTLLILDEAHLLSERLLEEVRIVSDFSQDGIPLIRVVMSGQLQLEEKLTSPSLEAFNQRIAHQVILEPLTRQQTLEYIEHRLNWAGRSSAEIFTPEALNLIARACDGLPRCINQLCDHSLLLAFVSDIAQVDAQIIQDALEDLKQLPLHWNTTVLSSGPLDALSHSHSASGDGDAEHEAEEELHDDSTVIDSTWEASTPGASFEIGAELETEPAFTPTLSISRTDTLAAASSRSSDKTPVDAHTSENPYRILDMHRSASARDFDFQPRHKAEMAHGDAPAEELVFDRYAMLDAGRTFGSHFGQTSNRTLGVHRDESLEIAQREAALLIPQFHHDLPTASAGSPDRMVDVVLSLLDHAEEHQLASVRRSASSELHGVDSNSPAPRSAFDGRSQVDSSVEEKIAEAVLDVCLDTQAAVQSRLADDPQSRIVPLDDNPTGITHRLDEGPRATRFDVVEPEGNAVEQGRISSGAVPRPNYKLIFSTLRRRQKRHA